MPFSEEAIKPPLHDQITELQRKIQLLEGDRTAYYESSQSSVRKNRECILQMREENKRLHQNLADALAGDEKVIKDAFQSRGNEKAAFRNMSGKVALKVLDQKVCDKMKRLNALKHTTQTYQSRLEDLQTQYQTQTQSMKPDNRGPQPGALRREEEAKSEGEASEEHAQKSEGEATEEHDPQKNLRELENRLEKAQLKCQEAEHIMRGYVKLKAHLQEESLTFQSQLDGQEAEILRQRQELRDLQVVNSDAHLSKDAAKAELQHKEEQVYKERKERERILVRYKKQAEERKAQAENVERRAQRAAMQPDELSSEAQRSATRVGEEERTVSTYEEAFRRIKEATGVTDTREVVERFISQSDTQKHLEELKAENESTLLQLKEERDGQQEHFQDMKYSGEAKLSSGQQMLEECERHLQAEQQRRDAAKERLDWLTRTLNTVRAGVEHLADKLQHIELGGSPAAELPLGSKEDVVELLPLGSKEDVVELLPLGSKEDVVELLPLGSKEDVVELLPLGSKEDVVELLPLGSKEDGVELLALCERKLLLLQEELQGKDLTAITKEMEDEEFYASIEGKLPHYNTRIQMPEAQRQDLYDDEEESGDDEGDIITRATLKRQSQLIIDSKNKRKTRTKKKKGKQ